MMRLSAPEKGSRVDRNFMGGAERCPRSDEVSDLADRGVPGGTVGTRTGRPQGLNPAPMQGVAPAGRRKKIAAAGARRAPSVSRSNRTAFAGRPPPPQNEGIVL